MWQLDYIFSGLSLHKTKYRFQGRHQGVGDGMKGETGSQKVVVEERSRSVP